MDKGHYISVSVIKGSHFPHVQTYISPSDTSKIASDTLLFDLDNQISFYGLYRRLNFHIILLFETVCAVHKIKYKKSIGSCCKQVCYKHRHGYCIECCITQFGHDGPAPLHLLSRLKNRSISIKCKDY